MATGFLKWIRGSWLVVSLVLTTLPLSKGQGTGSCTGVKSNTCRCIYEDGYYIDLSQIAKKGGFKFDYAPSTALGSPFYYAYNPCYPVTDTKDCTNVAACQKNPSDQSGKHYPIGDASSAEFSGSDSNIMITYSSTDDQGTTRKLEVTLVCDPTVTTPKLDIPGEKSTKNEYAYTLTSKCCCPNGCQAVADSEGLSFGSILCILFSCLLFTYLVAGILFMKFVRKAEGKEVIPNYSTWVQVPGLIKDGSKFTYSKVGQLCGKKTTTYEDI